MSDNTLSFNARKSLCVHLGEATGAELASLLARLTSRIEQLENENRGLQAQQTTKPATIPLRKVG